MAKNLEKTIQISDSESIDLEKTSSESDSAELEESSPESPTLRIGGGNPTESRKSGGSKNPKSKASSSNPIKSVGSKRRADEMESDAAANQEKGSTKSKQQVVVVGDEEKESSETSKKKKLFRRRRWSERDEIAVLNGMIAYSEDRKSVGKLPSMKGFYDFIKDGLDGEITIAQLNPKIRRMREKFETLKGNEEDGVEVAFSNSHEQTTYQLSKQVWGNGDGRFFGGPKGRRESAERKPQKDAAIEEDSVLKEKEEEDNEEEDEEEMPDGGQKLDGKSEWKKLKILEMEIHIQKLELMRSRTKLVLDALKASDK